MSDRLISFTVEHPQLEYSPKDCNMGRKKAQVWKNQASPALMLGSLNLMSPETSPLRSRASPSTLSISSKATPLSSLTSSQDRPLASLLQEFPKYTKAHPKYVPTSPIIESLPKNLSLSSPFSSSIHPNRRICDLASNMIMNRGQFNH